MVIRTITSLRDYVMDFDLGVQFEENLGPVDGRKCQVSSPSSAVWQQTGADYKVRDQLSAQPRTDVPLQVQAPQVNQSQQRGGAPSRQEPSALESRGYCPLEQSPGRTQHSPT